MSAKAKIYLDSNAGAPLKPQVLEALLPLFAEASREREAFVHSLSNPSSIHSHGRNAKRLLARAREQIALSFGPKCAPEEVVLTSGGSEANQLAIRGVLEPLLLNGQKPHWITTPVEHDSVLQMVEWFRKRGGSVTFLPVDENGAPVTEAIFDHLEIQTALVSLIWVNNETGVITDFRGIPGKLRERGIKLHLDGAQAWGKISFALNESVADLVSFSAPKIGALSGSGVLWVSRDVQVSPVILGKQERGRRGGTENLLGALAMGTAAESLNADIWTERIGKLRDQLQDAICRQIPGSIINGKGASRVGNTLNVQFEGIEGESLVMPMDLAGYSVSSGAACSSGVQEPSHVLMAMGRSREQAMAALRISLPDEHSWEQLEPFVTTLAETVERLRRLK